MKAVVTFEPGSSNQLMLVERPIPEPGVGWVLVRIRAFGLNRSELMTRKGLSPNVKFPRVLGIECAAEVEYDPSGQFEKGQKIFALMGGMGRDFDGSYAEYATLPKSILVPIQSSLPWATLAATPEMYQTVYGSLVLALNIQAGQTLLVRGGTSSIGMLTSQVANHKGITVIATTRNTAKVQALLANGATHVLIDEGEIEHEAKALYPNGIDKALELVGVESLKDTMACLRPGGTACMTGMLSEKWSIPDFAPMEFIPPTVNLTIYDSGQIRSTSEIFQNFVEQVESGLISIKVSKVFMLDAIQEAHTFMESNQGAGKIVVVT